MIDIDISTLSTNFHNVKEGSIILFQKNPDGTFSPLALNRIHTELIQRVLAKCSEETPLAAIKEVKLADRVELLEALQESTHLLNVNITNCRSCKECEKCRLFPCRVIQRADQNQAIIDKINEQTKNSNEQNRIDRRGRA